MTITVYSTPTCPYCHMLKDFLRQKKVEFKDVDVSRDHEAAHRMISMSGQMGVPQTEINGKIIVGFDQEAIEEELKEMDSKKASA
ncbi:glutaredoxin family protein [Candidatus Woesearchaeota archaeon]|nr:glutaredoxin family protein [Candidatus Woesearchaeota archaeon]